MIDALAELLVARYEQWEAAHIDEIDLAWTTYEVARLLGLSRWKAAQAAWRSRRLGPLKHC
jgi:hypothetical protein